MFTATQNTSVTRSAAHAAPRRSGLAVVIRWLIDADAAWRDGRRMDRLSAHARRDMGLPPIEGETPQQIADRRFLSGQW